MRGEFEIEFESGASRGKKNVVHPKMKKHEKAVVQRLQPRHAPQRAARKRPVRAAPLIALHLRIPHPPAAVRAPRWRTWLGFGLPHVPLTNKQRRWGASSCAELPAAARARATKCVHRDPRRIPVRQWLATRRTCTRGACSRRRAPRFWMVPTQVREAMRGRAKRHANRVTGSAAQGKPDALGPDRVCIAGAQAAAGDAPWGRKRGAQLLLVLPCHVLPRAAR